MRCMGPWPSLTMNKITEIRSSHGENSMKLTVLIFHTYSETNFLQVFRPASVSTASFHSKLPLFPFPLQYVITQFFVCSLPWKYHSHSLHDSMSCMLNTIQHVINSYICNNSLASFPSLSERTARRCEAFSPTT